MTAEAAEFMADQISQEDVFVGSTVPTISLRADLERRRAGTGSAKTDSPKGQRAAAGERGEELQSPGRAAAAAWNLPWPSRIRRPHQFRRLSRPSPGASGTQPSPRRAAVVPQSPSAARASPSRRRPTPALGAWFLVQLVWWVRRRTDSSIRPTRATLRT